MAEVSFKVVLQHTQRRQTMHRFRGDFAYAQLMDLMSYLWGGKKQLVVEYTDEDGDNITVLTDVEWKECVRLHLEQQQRDGRVLPLCLRVCKAASAPSTTTATTTTAEAVDGTTTTEDGFAMADQLASVLAASRSKILARKKWCPVVDEAFSQLAAAGVSSAEALALLAEWSEQRNPTTKTKASWWKKVNEMFLPVMPASTDEAPAAAAGPEAPVAAQPPVSVQATPVVAPDTASTVQPQQLPPPAFTPRTSTMVNIFPGMSGPEAQRLLQLANGNMNLAVQWRLGAM